MFLGDLMEQLNSLSKGIEKLEKKYEFFIEEERENLYTEEQFVYSEIEGILESLLEVKETVETWTVGFRDKEFKGRCPLFFRRRSVDIERT